MATGGSGFAKSSTERKRELDAVMPKGCATEWWRPGHRGIGEAGHASPLGILEPRTAGTMESPVRRKPHAGFGERPGETDQQ